MEVDLAEVAVVTVLAVRSVSTQTPACKHLAKTLLSLLVQMHLIPTTLVLLLPTLVVSALPTNVPEPMPKIFAWESLATLP
jgi:hypothetical protein